MRNNKKRQVERLEGGTGGVRETWTGGVIEGDAAY